MSQPVVSFCFDDGFLVSSGKIRALFEAKGLAATFCVLASPLESVDDAHRNAEFADWDFWRSAQSAGHEIAPHGWAHERLSQMPHIEAQAGLSRMFAVFENELIDFSRGRSVFHAAYLQVPEPLLSWLQSITKAVRISTGGLGRNMVAISADTGIVDCITFGPCNVARSAQARIDRFLADERDWLVLVFHGLDGEGWGSLSSDELSALIEGVLTSGAAILPVGKMLDLAPGSGGECRVG